MPDNETCGACETVLRQGLGLYLIAVAATWGAREAERRLSFAVWIERAAACECQANAMH
jgi:hypothetical protein